MKKVFKCCFVAFVTVYALICVAEFIGSFLPTPKEKEEKQQLFVSCLNEYHSIWTCNYLEQNNYPKYKGE